MFHLGVSRRRESVRCATAGHQRNPNSEVASVNDSEVDTPCTAAGASAGRLPSR